MKRKILIIGIGAGNPEYVTIQAVNALNQVSVFFIPNKGIEKEGLARLRREICERFIANASYRMVNFDTPTREASKPSYGEGVKEWHANIESIYERLLVEELGKGSAALFSSGAIPAFMTAPFAFSKDFARKASFRPRIWVIPGIDESRHKLPHTKFPSIASASPS